MDQGHEREQHAGQAVEVAHLGDAAQDVDDDFGNCGVVKLLRQAGQGQSEEDQHDQQVLDAFAQPKADYVVMISVHRFTTVRQRWRRICSKSPPTMKGMMSL